MTSVITGDIVNSRRLAPEKWLEPLKGLLSSWGNTPKSWEITRGDNIQLEIAEPGNSLLAAIRIKALLRTIKGLDVRIAIGIGEKTYDAPNISESNGPAFINSGEKFETLKKIKQTLAVQSPWPDLDKELNLLISLASIVMDKWSPSSAEIIALSLQDREKPQIELAAQLAITQSSVSERQTRAHFSQIIELETYYCQKIQQKLA